MVKYESLRINMFRITHTGNSVNFPVTAGKHAHLPPIEEQTRENSKKSSLAFKEDPISSSWNSRSFDV